MVLAWAVRFKSMVWSIVIQKRKNLARCAANVANEPVKTVRVETFVQLPAELLRFAAVQTYSVKYVV